MKNPLGFLFGGSKVAEKVLDTAIKGGDALFHTEEEKLQYKQDCHELFLKQLEAEGSAQSASSITRRILAFMLIGLFTCYGLAAGMAWAFEKTAMAQGYINLMNEIDVLVGMVMTFYFGRHFVDNVVGKK